jgi:sugar-specific transcriptional regulator TrmB
MRQKTKLAPSPDMEIGPLASIIPCNESKILDHLVVFESFGYSASDISEIVRIKAKTTLDIIKKLEKMDIIKKTAGKTTMYQLNLRSPITKSIKKLAFEIASKRINEFLAKR